MPTPHEILKQFWNFDHFRPKQEDIILSILEGKDTLALLPTGGGKSVCFQVPALCMEGICIVVSPLVALMNDQVNNLRQRGIEAWAVTSALGPREIDRILDNCIYGQVKFLYVSPERLKNELFLTRFAKMTVSMIAVDEAHCISQWGYDFRPEYLQIADIRPMKPGVPILALTASATPLVVKDIQDKLLFPEEHVIATSFSRNNLSYNVNEQEDKEGKLLEICSKMSGTGIIYCGSRIRTREISDLLNKHKITSAFYHAGMTTQEREKVFKDWMKNKVRIICATNAFGMGIDKPDVRFVLHADVPASPEAYFQEAGRGGRDGLRAYAVLVWNSSDLLRLQTQLEQKFPPREYVRRVYKAIGNFLQLAPGAGKDIPYPFNITTFSRNFDFKHTEAVYALKLLETAGYIHLDESAFLGSRMIFLVGRQDLYSYQVANPTMDPLIKVILRMYGGLFEQYVQVKEGDIAKNAKLSLKQLAEKLAILHSQKVIDYASASNDPMLTYLTGRMHEDSIILAPEVYENRKKSETERVAVMEKYIERKRCRSIQLLEYFGEKDPEACGHCDICRENKKHGLAPVEYEELNSAVMELAIHKEFTIEDLPALLPSFAREHVIEYARWKIDSGELILNDKLQITLPGLEG